ncbi:XRE family transcriptional regulator, partial [Enterococcus faecium]|nr:XRE family transcriptional regulator [Enterococcus faecium]
HVPVSYLMGLDETNSIEQPNLDRIKTARLEKKDKIVKNIASLDSDYFTELSNLYFSMTSLLEVKLQEDDSDFLFLKSILEDSFEYTILFAKQKKFINKALNLNIDERKELESELFGNLTQVQVNNLKREITARLISKLQ